MTRPVVAGVIAVAVVAATLGFSSALPSTAATAVTGSAVVSSLVPAAPAAVVPVVRVSSSGTVQPGSPVQVTGSGFVKGAAVVVRLDGAVLARVPASGMSWFSARVTVPAATAVGSHRVTATQPGTTGAGGGPVAAATMVAVHTDWPEGQGGPRGNGFARLENGITTTNASALTVAWTVANPKARAVAVVAGVAYVSEDVDDTNLIGGVAAYDAATGTKFWENQQVGIELATPLVLDGKVWVVDSGGQVVVLDAKTGVQVAVINTKGDTGQVGPIFIAGLVVLATGVAIDPATYRVVWDVTAYTPVGAGGLMFGNGSGAVLAAVDAATGKTRWVADPPSPGADYATQSIAVGGSSVLVSWSTGQVGAYDQATGALQWLTPAKAQYGGGVLASDGTRVYVQANGGVSSDGRYRGLDATTGALDWVGPLSVQPVAPPVIAGGVVFAITLTNDGTSGGFSSIDAATGAVLDILPVSGTSPHGVYPIAVADGRLYYADDNQDLIAVTPTG